MYKYPFNSENGIRPASHPATTPASKLQLEPVPHSN